jgi:hypothetical protein
MYHDRRKQMHPEGRNIVVKAEISHDTNADVIPFLLPGELQKAMPDDDLKAEIERLRSENAALKQGAASGLRMKVSEKGALSIYGMGRFPVTLYKEQWLKLLAMSDDIRAFIAANDAQLKAKQPK